MAGALFPLFLAFVMTSLVRSGHESDVRCLSCSNVARPEACVTLEQCNLGEVCFAHEVFDHNGLRSFRLGCESQDLCRLAKAAQASQGINILGRRQATNPTAPPLTQDKFCFQCCSSDDCNAALCEEVFHLNRTESRPPHPGNCPPAFVKGPNSCLYFHDVPVRWSAARAACQKLGSDLVKVEDQTEDLFIVSQLKLQHPPASSRGFWIGAHRDVITNEYVWLDYTPVTYTRWGQGEPNKDLNNDMFILYSNPAIFSFIPNWEWADYEDKDPFVAGLICERAFV